MEGYSEKSRQEAVFEPAQDSQVRVTREDVAMEDFVGSSSAQAAVEGEVALPGGLREETRVLGCEAMAVILSAQALENRAQAEGKVIFHVLYSQGDPTQIASLEASAEFSHVGDIAGSAQGDAVHASVTVEHVESSAQSGRLHMRAILKIYQRVLSSKPVSVVTGVQGAGGLMTRTTALPICLTASTGESEALIRDEFELREVLQIKDTLYATASATAREVMGGENLATVSGEILLEVTHLSTMPDRPLVITRHTLPFEQSVPLTGEGGDEIACEAVVKDVAVLSQDGQDGDRVLRAEVLLGVSARATKRKESQVLLDAYTTQGDALKITQQPVRRAMSYAGRHTAESGKLTLLLESDQPPARAPLKAMLRPVLLSAERQAGRVLIDGMMECTLLYMTEDSDAPVSLSTEEPFRAVFSIELGDLDAITLTPTNIDVSKVTSDRVEVRYILHLNVSDVTFGREVLVTQLSQVPAEPVSAGIVLYCAKPGERLWDIAKKYRVSQESVRRMNPTLQEDFTEDTNVILWPRSV